MSVREKDDRPVRVRGIAGHVALVTGAGPGRVQRGRCRRIRVPQPGAGEKCGLDPDIPASA